MKIVIDGLCNPSLLEREIPFCVPEPELIFYQQHFDAFILRTFLYLTILSEIVLSQFFDQFPEVMPVAQLPDDPAAPIPAQCNGWPKYPATDRYALDEDKML